MNEGNKPQLRNLANFLLLIAILFFSWLIGRYFQIDPAYLRNLFLKFPLIYSGIIFVLLYVVVSFFIWITKDIFKVIAAIIFGAYLSAVLVYLAEMINAVILFNLSHFLGRDFVKSKLKGGLWKLDEKIDRFGFWGIFSLRIVPLVPFRFLDIAAGLTRTSFKKYFLASVLGSPLRIFWLQFILASVGLSVFKDTNSILNYFLNNPVMFIFSLIYLVVAIILGTLFKKIIF